MSDKKDQQLSIPVAVIKEIDGIEMGVLSDDTPFLTGRSLAKFCDVAIATIIGHKDRWEAGQRTSKLAAILAQQGYTSDKLYVSTIKVGTMEGYAYPDVVCMAFLEYFAFDAQQTSERALRNYRLLARQKLRDFIYAAVGYDPKNLVPALWREYHDRMTLHSVPSGYFSVFKESAEFVLAVIRNGLKVDQRTIPDGSIGSIWGRHWTSSGLAEKYGERATCAHNYPDYFPQAKSNPQPIKIYPIAALPEFRTWLDRVYIPEKFSDYLDGKVAKGVLPASTAELLLSAVQPLELQAGDADDE